MGINYIGLIAEWEPAVAAYRAAGTDFYWDTDLGEDLAFPAEEDYLDGYRLFADLSNCYDKIRPQLLESERESVDAFLRLVGGFEFEEDWDLGMPPNNDLLADAGGPPPEEPIEFAMRPSTVRHALELAATISWKAVEAACDRTDFSDAVGETRIMQGYNDLQWMLGFYLDWMKRAAEADRGLIVLISI